MSKPLTAAAVAKVRPDKERLEIPDGGCNGLYLLIQPSGAKSWALRFRRPNGRTAKLFLGSVYEKPDTEPETKPTIGGHLTLAAAHSLVGDLRLEIAQGRDPAAAHLKDKRQRKASAEDAAKNTFEAAARAFIEKYSSKKVRRWHEQARLLGLEPDDDKKLITIEKGLADRWGKRPVAEIDCDDIEAIIDETRQFGAPGLERRSEGPTESRARAMLSCLSKMFDWLVQQPPARRLVSVNPCDTVKRPETPQARDRVLSNTEIVQFWKATDDTGEIFGTLLKLLLLTGCRLNEVAGMRYSEISDDDTTWLIPAERTKNHKPHIVPLPPLARKLLQGMKRIEGCPYVFSTTGKTPVSGWSKTKDRLDEAMQPRSPWRLHDLRRTAATGMSEIGIAPHIVEAALNHISGARAGVAGTYNRAAYLPEKKAALERWAAHIDGLVRGREAVVLPLRA